MKIQSSSVVILAAVVSSVGAFCPQQNNALKHATSLRAIKGGWLSPAAAAAVGWTLATQIAGASMPPANEQMPSFPGESTTLIAAETIDFSLPSYNPNMGGFGEGTEAKLSEVKGGDERDKQKEAMLKAEAARQARLAQKKEDALVREAEGRARAEERKAAQADRFKEIFQ